MPADKRLNVFETAQDALAHPAPAGYLYAIQMPPSEIAGKVVFAYGGSNQAAVYAAHCHYGGKTESYSAYQKTDPMIAAQILRARPLEEQRATAIECGVITRELLESTLGREVADRFFQPADKPGTHATKRRKRQVAGK
jgi:hypothetical protein